MTGLLRELDMELNFANVAATVAVLVAILVWVQGARTRSEILMLRGSILDQLDYLRRHIDVVAAGHAKDIHSEVDNQLAAIQRTLEARLPPATPGQIPAPIENLVPALRSKRKQNSI